MTNDEDLEIIEEDEMPSFLKKEQKERTIVERAFYDVEPQEEKKDEVVEIIEDDLEFKPLEPPVKSTIPTQDEQIKVPKKNKIPLFYIIGGITIIVLLIVVVLLLLLTSK